MLGRSIISLLLTYVTIFPEINDSQCMCDFIDISLIQFPTYVKLSVIIEYPKKPHHFKAMG
jgi:hypothetical protein